MTTINTIDASKHWDNEIDFLKRIDFVKLRTDIEGDYIGIQTDEEGNDEIKLTKKSAKWLIQELTRLVDFIEKCENFTKKNDEMNQNGKKL